MARYTDEYEERGGCGCRTVILGGLGLAALLAVLVYALQRRVETQIEIDAPPLVVWSNVVDLDGYARWNPYIDHIAGEAVEGSELRASIVVGDFDPIELVATVDVAREPEEFAWEGRVFFPWIFDDDHTIRIQALDGGRSRVTQSANYRGLVPAFLWWKIESEVRHALASHNEKLKSESEGR